MSQSLKNKYKVEKSHELTHPKYFYFSEISQNVQSQISYSHRTTNKAYFSSIFIKISYIFYVKSLINKSIFLPFHNWTHFSSQSSNPFISLILWCRIIHICLISRHFIRNYLKNIHIFTTTQLPISLTYLGITYKITGILTCGTKVAKSVKLNKTTSYKFLLTMYLSYKHIVSW